MKMTTKQLPTMMFFSPRVRRPPPHVTDSHESETSSPAIPLELPPNSDDDFDVNNPSLAPDGSDIFHTDYFHVEVPPHAVMSFHPSSIWDCTTYPHPLYQLCLFAGYYHVLIYVSGT
ncbi:uncharacterized protein [Palaemon carinicauda]|uniref:uncharacterized protein n=1 Tax=Palaemon carinicauda TaxID=392227 RepID=UPI0035B69FE1